MWLFQRPFNILKGCFELLELGKHVIPLATRLLEQYGEQIADKSSMAKMVGTNKAYAMARTPLLRSSLGVMPDPNHRVVTDDIGWGLCVLVSIAERLEDAGVHTNTTMMRMLIEWHQKIMGKAAVSQYYQLMNRTSQSFRATVTYQYKKRERNKNQDLTRQSL